MFLKEKVIKMYLNKTGRRIKRRGKGERGKALKRRERGMGRERALGGKSIRQ